MKKFIALVQILPLAVIFIPWLHVSSADNYTLPGEDYTNVTFPPDAPANGAYFENQQTMGIQTVELYESAIL